ncbi:hypothetical protein RMCBS344292_12269 [Rhizopus microsporus]|nr:hypothetical protein RMCBS344292_12269 [Rhizopus microsporus]
MPTVHIQTPSMPSAKHNLLWSIKRLFMHKGSHLDMKKIMHKNDAAERRHHLESIRRRAQQIKLEYLILSHKTAELEKRSNQTEIIHPAMFI